MYVDFEITRGPLAPSGDIKIDHLAKARTNDKCLKCPNALLCISGHVAVQQCKGCMRTYIDGGLIPGGVVCEGFVRQPQVFVPSCALCAEEYVKKHMAGAMDQFVGNPITSETLEQVKAHLKDRAQILLNMYGWEIKVDVLCE